MSHVTTHTGPGKMRVVKASILLTPGDEDVPRHYWTTRSKRIGEILRQRGYRCYLLEPGFPFPVHQSARTRQQRSHGPWSGLTESASTCRLHMDGGMLMGVRYDGAPKGDTVHVTIGLYDGKLEEDVQVSYIGDDRSTDANEANTKLTVAGQSISLGDLLGTGMASKAADASDGMAGEFVKSAVEELMDLRTEAELYAKYQAAADNDAGRGAFDERLNDIADRAQKAIDMIFGGDGPGNKQVDVIAQGTLPVEDTDTATEGNQASNTNADYIRATQTVRGLNRLLDALSSADAFVDATKDGNNGVFENALGNNEDTARKAFSANKSEYTVYFGTTASTRYGAIALKQRVSKDPDVTTAADGTVTNAPDPDDEAEPAAIYGMRYAFDGAGAQGTGTTDNEDVGAVGAFSYANVSDTLRARNLPQTGGAVYMGGTVAVTPGGTLYNGDMRIDVNFRSQSVFGRVSELRDKDNNLWKYLDSDVTTIYLPRQNYNNLTQFGGSGDEDPRRTGTGNFQQATIVYADSQGFSTNNPSRLDTNARFAGRFIGENGAEITGTWSLGQPVEGGTDPPQSNALDVIYGSYGVTRQDGEGPVGPADGTAGGAAKTTVVLPVSDAGTTPDDYSDDIVGATFQGDTDVAGILRLGKRSTGGGKDTNNDFDLTTIFASPGADPKKTVTNSPTHVEVVVEHIKAQRAIYVIYAEQVGGDSDKLDDLANVGRQNAWKSINDFVLDHIFNKTAVAPADADTSGSIELSEVSDINNLSSPLGSYYYPMTRNNRPDDQEALDRIDALLAAFEDVFAFQDALKDDGEGVFDSQPALDRTTGYTTDANGNPVDATVFALEPFPLNDVFDGPDTNTTYDGDEAASDIFGRVTSQTQLFTLSTDYTRFGVWFRRETASAVHGWNNHGSPTADQAETPTNTADDGDTGATSPGSYAYSWLSQSTYRTDRPVATYPSSGLATYEGKTLANLRDTHIYVGDALIRVNWSPLDDATGAATSTIVPIFSNFRKWQDNSLDRLMHDHDGDNATASKIVDEIVFRGASNTDLVLTHGTGADTGKLMITTGAAETH